MKPESDSIMRKLAALMSCDTMLPLTLVKNDSQSLIANFAAIGSGPVTQSLPRNPSIQLNLPPDLLTRASIMDSLPVRS